MAKSDSPFAISKLAAKVQNIGQARAVLGKTADLLREGYDKVAGVASIFVPGTGALESGLRDSLDSVNALAMAEYKIFAGATPDLFDEEISFQNAAKIGLCMERARQVLTQIEDANDTEYWNIVEILEEALRAVGEAVVWTVQTIAKAAVAGTTPIISAFWPWLLLIGAAVFLYYFYGAKLIAHTVQRVTT